VFVAKFGSPASPIIVIAGRVRSLFDDPPLLFGALDGIGCRLDEVRVASLDTSSLVVATMTEATESITPILMMAQVVGSDVTGDKIIDDKQHAFIRRPAQVRHDLEIHYIREAYFRLRFPTHRQPSPAELAYAFALIGRPDRSVPILRRLIAEHPGDAELLYQLGEVLRQLDQHEEAVGLFERSAALAPEQIDPRSALAITLSHLGRHREAKRRHTELIAMTNGDFGEYMNLASVCQTLGELDEAWRAVQMALAREPKSTHGHALAANLAYARGDLTAAHAHSEKARAGLVRVDRASPMYDIIDNLLRVALGS
jgi:tetratricopeptide (TPR) repeat protein